MAHSPRVIFKNPPTLWSERREASLNWLALGLLLAAWNASDNDASQVSRQRPAVLRGTLISEGHKSVNEL